MITLTAKIDIIDKGKIDTASVNFAKNNISADFSEMIDNIEPRVTNPFIIGSSKIGDRSTYSKSKVGYYIGTSKANESGIFTEPYVINISGADITSVTIAFDTANNRHPNIITIDGKEYKDDDAIFTVTDLDSNFSVHTVTINNWNTPNYPLVVSSISVTLSIDINRRNLISIDRSIQTRSDVKLPSYGIISNTGSIQFNDLNGEIKDYAEMLLLTSGLKVSMYINNTLAKVQEQIGVFNTSGDWDYDNDNRVVSVSFRDDLEEWQNIDVEGIDYDPRKPEPKTAKYFYEYLWSKTPSKYGMYEFLDLTFKTRTILEDTIIPYPLLNSGKLWSQWTKLCELCGLYIYKDNFGRTTCAYYRGS